MKELFNEKIETITINVSGKTKSQYRKACYALENALKKKMISQKKYNEDLRSLNNLFTIA